MDFDPEGSDKGAIRVRKDELIDSIMESKLKIEELRKDTECLEDFTTFVGEIMLEFALVTSKLPVSVDDLAKALRVSKTLYKALHKAEEEY